MHRETNPGTHRKCKTLAFPLTRYGRREWLGATGLAALGCAALIVMGALMSWLCLLPLPLIVIVWVWVVWFFRDPERTPPDEPGTFLSPADGTVADISPVDADSDLGTEGLRIGIFMSIFNVHVNRAPCDGRVAAIDRSEGGYADARTPEAAASNQSTTIHLACDHGGREVPVIVRQIAGLVARRIVTDLIRGQEVKRGRRIGMIKFGSRLELIVPEALARDVRVAVGDRTIAGETVLLATREAAPHDGDAQRA